MPFINKSSNILSSSSLKEDDDRVISIVLRILKHSLRKDYITKLNRFHFYLPTQNLALSDNLDTLKTLINSQNLLKMLEDEYSYLAPAELNTEKNDFGNTPLWTAVFNANGNYELVELLLKHGANPNSVNNADNTPLKFAETIQDEELIKKLKTHYNKV